MGKRIAFQESAYPCLSGARAWTLEAYADMLVKHHGGSLEPTVSLKSTERAALLAPLASPLYAVSSGVLRLMFGESHEYFTSVYRKKVQLEQELERLLGPGAQSPKSS